MFFSTYQLALYEELISSTDELLAGVAAKGVKEAAYHNDHATQWTIRLGDGTDESHRRMQAAIDRLWPFTAELFEADDVDRDARRDRASASTRRRLRSRWALSIAEVLSSATMTPPQATWSSHGGRRGVHTEGFGYLLAEMQYLHRSYPGGEMVSAGNGEQALRPTPARFASRCPTPRCRSSPSETWASCVT